MNIYKNKRNYYYAERPVSRKDKVIDKKVTVDYAFDFCAKYNFGVDLELSRQKMPNYKVCPENMYKGR